MKKLLLGTTALITATAFSGAALAKDPTITVGGHYDIIGGWTDQEGAFETGPNSRDFKIKKIPALT